MKLKKKYYKSAPIIHLIKQNVGCCDDEVDSVGVENGCPVVGKRKTTAVFKNKSVCREVDVIVGHESNRMREKINNSKITSQYSECR